LESDNVDEKAAFSLDIDDGPISLWERYKFNAAGVGRRFSCRIGGI
jgi:hypothetical protein